MEYQQELPRKKRMERVGEAMACKRFNCFNYDPHTNKCVALVYDRNGRGYDAYHPCPFFKTHLDQIASVDKAHDRQRRIFGHILEGPIGKLENEPVDADE